ncbi:MAG: metal-sulfur cluster assembly factor [Thermodesulfobacteriota bacterium]
MKKLFTINKDEEPKSPEEKQVNFTKFEKTAESDEPITEDRVMDALKSVYDPELPVNIVDLGLIYDVNINGRNVNIKMSLTTPGCGMGATIAKQAEMAIKPLGVKNVFIDIVWDPPWNPDMMSDEAKDRLGIS